MLRGSGFGGSQRVSMSELRDRRRGPNARRVRRAQAHTGDAFARFAPGHAVAWNLNRWRVNRFCRASSGLVHLACFVTVSRTREVTLGEMTSEMTISDGVSDEVSISDGVSEDESARMEPAPTY